MRLFIKLIPTSYHVEHQLSFSLCFEFFILVLVWPRRFDTVGFKMAISRSKMIFLFDFSHLYIYRFNVFVCKTLKKPMLGNISQNRLETSPSAQCLMWYMTTAPART